MNHLYKQADCYYRLILDFLILFFFLNPTQSVVPDACLSNITSLGGSGICCPIPKGYHLPCGGPGIGYCQQHYVQRDKVKNYLKADDRYGWPLKFFTYLCACEAQRFGVACDECWFGWKGPNCNESVTYVRRNIFSFNKTEKIRLVKIVSHTIRVKSNYWIMFDKDPKTVDPMKKTKFIRPNLQYLFAYLHRFTSRSTLYNTERECDELDNLDLNHGTIGFSTWHRYFMLNWEKELRKIATRMYGWKDFAIPYWDWVDSEKCDVCTNDLFGAPGRWKNGIRLIHDSSPFSRWIEYCSGSRSPTKCRGCHTGWPNFQPLNRHYMDTSFPKSDELLFTLTRRNFFLFDSDQDSKQCRGFHRALEGFCSAPNQNSSHLYMHNKVHNMVRGSFCCAATAASDPLFIPHHSQMDRIFQIWFKRNHCKPTSYPNHDITMGNCRECNLVGFIPPVRNVDMFVDLEQLGVTYDNYKFGKHNFDGNKFIRHGIGNYT